MAKRGASPSVSAFNGLFSRYAGRCSAAAFGEAIASAASIEKSADEHTKSSQESPLARGEQGLIPLDRAAEPAKLWCNVAQTFEGQLSRSGLRGSISADPARAATSVRGGIVLTPFGGARW